MSIRSPACWRVCSAFGGLARFSKAHIETAGDKLSFVFSVLAAFASLIALLSGWAVGL